MEVVSASNVSHEFIQTQELIRPAGELEVGKSMLLHRSLNYHLLVDLAKQLSVGKKAIVVIAHGNAYEVQRLPDGSKLSTFYKHLPAEYKVRDDAKSFTTEVIRICKEYGVEQLEKLKNYDKTIDAQMQKDGVVPHSYLSRRLCNLTLFRNAENGAKIALHDAIDDLCSEGRLIPVNKEACVEVYNLRGKAFKIVDKG